MSTTNARVLKLVLPLIDQRRRDSINTESRLLDEKILDSMGLIQIVAELEKEFSISIRNEDLTFQNFNTVLDMSALVERSTVVQ